MIDWMRVKDLRNEIGDENFDEIVELFLEEADAAVAQLGADLPVAELATALHSLKGSALNLGFSTLAQQCGTAEARAANGERPAIAEVRATYAQSRAAFGNGRDMAAA